MRKPTEAYLYNRILLWGKKKKRRNEILMLYKNMEESQMPWTKLKKSGTKYYVMHGSIDLKFEK